MSKTVTIECKQYQEWTPEVQKKILKKYREINVEHNDWWDYLYEYWADKLAEMGYDVKDTAFKDEHKWIDNKYVKTGNRIPYTTYNISFSGFWSQGDGASFTGSVDIVKWLQVKNNPKYSRILKLLENSVSSELEYSAEIKRTSNHYVHERTVSLQLQWYPDKVYDMPNIHSLLEQIEKDIDEDIIDQCQAIYSDLEKEYDYLTSDEQVADALMANEYEFDEQGKRW